MKDKYIIIVAHGSPRAEANQEFSELCSTLQSKLPHAIINAAYLGSAKPSLAEALDRLIMEEAQEIKILPYFLSAGKHTASDIPDIVSRYQHNYPQLKLTLSTHLGGSPKMIDFLLAHLSV